MAIQKLLPNYFPSGQTSSNLIDIESTFWNHNYDMEGYNGSISENIGINTDVYVPYIRKSISSPDNSSYLRMDSGVISTWTSNLLQSFNMAYIYDCPSLSIDGLISRFIYSGAISFHVPSLETIISYYVSEPYLSSGNYSYRSVGSIQGRTSDVLSVDGNPSGNFCVFTSKQLQNTNISPGVLEGGVYKLWSIENDLLTNLLQSGSHIVCKNYLVLNNDTKIRTNQPAFSAFEIEISGQFFNKNVDLFISGPEPTGNTLNLYTSGDYPKKELDLYTYGAYPANNNLSLIVEGYFPSGNLTLYTKADEIPTNGINLYTESYANVSGNKSLNLFTVSSVSYSGELDLYLNGGGYGDFNDNLNLFVYSKQPSGTLPLYLKNSLDYKNKSLNLYTNSYIYDSGDIPFHINGGGIDLRQNELTLYTRSAIQNSGDLSLSIVGNIATGPINMYVSAEAVASTSGQVPLFISSALNSGIYNSFDISIQSETFDSSLPMFMPVDSVGESVSNVSIVILNDTVSNKDVLLYIENNIDTSSASYTLFTKGNGTLNGGNISNSSMNLFINRSNEGVYNSVPMMISGPSGINNYIPLIMSGGTISNNDITLVIPNTSSISRSGISAYINGFLY